MMSTIGLLITNTGTPDAPTPAAVRRYLREFLSDKRVVHLPRLIWLPLLHSVILPFRAHRSIALYQKIWTADGSPMRALMKKVAAKLQAALRIDVEIGMHYGHPSISAALKKLQQKGIDNLIVLPLFPQYSNATTAATLDRTFEALNHWLTLPSLHTINDYSTSPHYIDALAATLTQAWERSQGPLEHLLISFHGMPARFVEAGDPYAKQCEQTAQLLAKKLALPSEKWTLCYQSKFGYDKWLKPATQTLLTELPQRGIRQVEVICPGFAVDCLETLEEIEIRGKTTFLQAGGQTFRYIPALNDSAAHIDMLVSLIEQYINT